MTMHTWITNQERDRFEPVSGQITNHLDPGYYRMEKSFSDIRRDKIDMREDEVFDVSPVISKLFSEMNHFWNAREKYQQLGIPHKRGIPLFGEPGTGKSSIVRIAVDQVTNMGATLSRAAQE